MSLWSRYFGKDPKELFLSFAPHESTWRVVSWNFDLKSHDERQWVIEATNGEREERCRLVFGVFGKVAVFVPLERAVIAGHGSRHHASERDAPNRLIPVDDVALDVGPLVIAVIDAVKYA